jgi:hypothetical protein
MAEYEYVRSVGKMKARTYKNHKNQREHELCSQENSYKKTNAGNRNVQYDEIYMPPVRNDACAIAEDHSQNM